MDLQEERGAFERSPKVARRLSYLHPTIVWFGEDNLYHSSFEGFQDMVHWLNGGWEAWQAAKAQAVPEGFIQVPIKLPEDAIYSLARKCFEEGQSTWNKFGQFNESNKERWIQNEMNIIKNLHIDFLRTFESL